MSAPDRRALLDRDNDDLSIRKQCKLLSVARSGVYRAPRPTDDDDLALMRSIDELFMAWPFLGSRRMATMLRADGWRVNRKRVQRLMRTMGIVALGPKPRTTKPAPGHKVFPYLLRGLVIERPNQVWCADITYIPIGRGFLYLVAIMDWASRAVLAWRLSNTMDVSFCVAALEEALARFGRPGMLTTYGRRLRLQHRPGQPVHIHRLHRHARRRRHPHLDGRARPMDGQRVHRAAVALAQARGRLSEGLCRRPRGQRRDRSVDRLLQHAAAAQRARPPHAHGGVARRRDRRARPDGCGHDAALGQRWRVAHMPTAATTAATGSLMVLGERNGRDAN